MTTWVIEVLLISAILGVMYAALNVGRE